VIRVKNALAKLKPPPSFEVIEEDETPKPPRRTVFITPPPPPRPQARKARPRREEYEDDYQDEYEDEERPRTKGENRRYARDLVSGPAMALLICAIITVVMMVLSIGYDLVLLLFGGLDNGRKNAIGLSPTNKIIVRFSLGIIGLILNIFVVMGASQMKNLKSRSTAMMACIASMVPCVGPCFFLGLPFGIWGIIVLSNPRVSKAFR